MIPSPIRAKTVRTVPIGPRSILMYIGSHSVKRQPLVDIFDVIFLTRWFSPMNEFSVLCNLIGAGFAFAVGFRGFDAFLYLVDSFLQRYRRKKAAD